MFNCFKINYVAVYDKDHQSRKSPEQRASSDADSQLIEDKIHADLGCSVVFENDIEEEMGLATGGKSKPFEALKHVSADGFIIPDPLAEKLRLIYS